MEYKLHNAAQLRHSANPYADNYTGFIWNGHHSSDFNCFIENTGHLTFEPAPEFSNSNVTPAFYDGSIYTGTQVNSKKLQLNLVFYHLTLADFNKALAWLNYKKVSSFLLDYDPNWRYQCKLNSLGTVEKYVDGYCINAAHGSLKKEDLYICRMQVSFETIDIHNAISTYGSVYCYAASQNVDPSPIYPEQITVPIPSVIKVPSSTELATHSVPVPFRVHLSNFTNKQIILYQLVQEDEITSSIPLCSIDLNLDDGQKASLHYDSKTGAVTMLNCLINSLRNGNGDLLCNYCATLSNITIPAYGQIQLALSSDYNGEIMIEYDFQTSVI